MSNDLEDHPIRFVTAHTPLPGGGIMEVGDLIYIMAFRDDGDGPVDIEVEHKDENYEAVFADESRLLAVTRLPTRAEQSVIDSVSGLLEKRVDDDEPYLAQMIVRVQRLMRDDTVSDSLRAYLVTSLRKEIDYEAQRQVQEWVDAQ